MLKLDTVTVTPGWEPPRPTINPRRRSIVLHDAVGDQAEHVEDWGLAASRAVRFVSSESQGLLTGTQVTALLALYEAGQSFSLETDLLKPLGGSADVYTARFDPETPPTFTPATPGGQHYYLDISLLIAA